MKNLISSGKQRQTTQKQARNGSCQTIIREYLQRLAYGLDPEIRQAVAAHPYTPGELLRRLSQDEDPLVRKVVAEQKQLPGEILRVLAQDKDFMVRQVVTRLEQAPEEVLQTLAQDEMVGVRRSVAENPQAPVEVLRLLCLDHHEWVRRSVAGNPHTPEEVLRTLASNISQNREVYHNLGLEVVMHLQASAEVLRLLALYPNRQVRWLTSFVQKLLAEFGEAGREQAWWAKFRWLLVDRPGCGWIGLFSIESQLYDVAALEIPEQPHQALITALATDWKGEHTFAVTDKRDAATVLHARLTFYKHLLDPLLPPVALQKLAQSPYWEVRYLMAIHKKTSWQTRQILSQDGNRYARAMAWASRELAPQIVQSEQDIHVDQPIHSNIQEKY